MSSPFSDDTGFSPRHDSSCRKQLVLSLVSFSRPSYAGVAGSKPASEVERDPFGTNKLVPVTKQANSEFQQSLKVCSTPGIPVVRIP